jgi:acetyltransferase-like isoleucine patch superfamily enzyme
VKKIRMARGTRIGHLNCFSGLDNLIMEEKSVIGNLNWVTAIRGNKHFHADRKRDLILGRHSAITSRHYFDCQEAITIGEFTTIAGIRSTFLTHEIDLKHNVQVAAPVRIGRYCFIGSGVILLSGSSIGDYSVVAAGAVVTKKDFPAHALIGGVPAQAIRENIGGEYFSRDSGYVR